MIISGNAGDGKTAFIQQFEALPESKGADAVRGANGAVSPAQGAYLPEQITTAAR